MKLAVAPSYREFREWCRVTGEIPDRTARWIGRPDHLRGLHGAEITVVNGCRCTGLLHDAAA